MTALDVFFNEVKLAARSAPRMYFAPLIGAIRGAVKEIRTQLRK